jgi:2OG-Fe(II) oxygenase superfamily
MIHLTRSGPTLAASVDFERLRAQFGRQHCIRLEGFLDPALLRFIHDRLDIAEFTERAHDDISVELCVQHDAALDLLHFLGNDERLFTLVQQLTGCGHIGCFLGRIYRMVPGSGHYDSWHSDAIDHRLIGMSVNLGARYEGGLFQLRERRSPEILCEMANTGPGDAILFRIAKELVHQVTAVDGTTPKTAFAGWFRSEPEFRALLADRARRGSVSVASGPP